MKTFIALLSLSVPSPSLQDADAVGGMLRYPDISATHVVFSYANDLWVVSREGGTALPLSSPAGREAFPRFSADGQRIAFMGNYEGNTDLYVLPTGGGTPTRVTYHGGTEVLCDWTPDGQLLYFTDAYAFSHRITELYTVSPEGGASTRMPVPYGANGAISPDGAWMAYTPIYRDTRTWKRYMGGMQADIWMVGLQENQSQQLTTWGGTDSIPMWHGARLYYLSDAGPEHRLNLWRYDTKSGERSQLTKFTDDDIRWPAMGPGEAGGGEVIFQLGTGLRIYDIAQGTVRGLPIDIPGDAAGLRPARIDAADFLQAADISSTGKRVCVEARGDIWSLPAEKGTVRNLTRSAGVAERDPSWSPDGRWIAYFSDESGEYELVVTQSDGKGETRTLTSSGGNYRSNIGWSPCSKWITFVEHTGEMILVDVARGEQKLVDTAPLGSFGGGLSPSWSHDSRWIAYAKPTDDLMGSRLYVYEVASGESQALTSGMFGDTSPVFDRKGDWLYYVSTREFSPTYSGLDTTWVYRNAQRLLAVPLRADVEDPWPLESDEEEWEEESDEDSEEVGDEAAGEGEGEAADSGGEEGAADSSDDASEAAAADDGLSGSWEGTITGEQLPEGSMSLNLQLSLAADGTVTGTGMVPLGTAVIEGRYDAATGKLTGSLKADDGMQFEIEATVAGNSMSGSMTAAGGAMSLKFEATRSASSGGGDEAGGDSDEARETVDIDVEGFEARAILLPTPAGNYGNLAVNDKNQVMYVRSADSGNGTKLFDLGEKAEKEVAAGVMGFSLSGDGKKMLSGAGKSLSIRGAAAGGSATPVPTKGMSVAVDLREEWRQVFRDAWRLNRQYFYDPSMHGVDWSAVYEHYAPMIEGCASREDVEFVIGEAMSELNVGHAYVRGAPGFERGESVAVGTLGVDFALENGAHRIGRIHRGAPWDTDARSPFDRPGLSVEEGEYLLAVDGVPLDPAQDPAAAFQGKAGVVVSLSLNTEPTMEGAREVRVKTLSDDRNLRYRAWIERNRAYVAEKSGGRIGYVYVPDTQVIGQNDLVRQLQGAFQCDAILVDERWNSGGQIPTRFVELLGRKRTNAWAVRAPKDLNWPPVHHDGPKCMLINGWSGSGGDCFPAYFRQFGLGKLIGRRTWGGLVGISGNPTLIDGGQIAVPTFAFYENDGTWAIEGHGVDPDIEVMDDPALMRDGGDPQLDAGIDHLMGLLEDWTWPKGRPAYPQRQGMGIAEEDK